MNRQLTKLINNSRVHEDEYKSAFNNKIAAKVVSDVTGEAWFIQNLGHPTKQVLQLWKGGIPEINFTTEAQSLAIHKEKYGL